MKTFNKQVLMFVLLSSVACTSVVENSRKAVHYTRGTIYNSLESAQELLSYNEPDNRPRPAQTRYCYEAQSDIICYDKPKPHLTNKLSGKQGPNVDMELGVHSPMPQVMMLEDEYPSVMKAEVGEVTVSADTDKLFNKKALENPPRSVMPSY